MTTPIGSAATQAVQFQQAAQKPAAAKDPDHDGDVDGPSGDKAGRDPLRTSVRVDTSA